jgi:signal peptidase I
MTTFLVIAIFIALFAASILITAACLRLGLRLVKVENVRWRTVMTTVLMLSVVNVILLFVAAAAASLGPNQAIAAVLIQLVGGVVAACLIVGKRFQVTSGRAFLAWLPTLLFPLVYLPFTHFILRPYVLEGFSAPTISMAPTILGTHLRATCAVCGAPAYQAVRDPRLSYSESPHYSICETNFHVSVPQLSESAIQSADRFMTLKFLQPRRWDVVTFRVPSAPDEIYVKRLVGMPGEEIVIKDGAVWANGVRLTPPASLGKMEYLSEIEGYDGTLAGTENRPARLREGEYFVLGDFSAFSFDSRFWSRGAPGHAAYSVPESHLLGVVTHVYWPPSRWRELR